MMFLFKFVISKIYFLLFRFVQSLYSFGVFKTHSFKNNNIISIGNLSVGGTGKTPMVAYISTILSELNMSHVVISRGYKRKSRGELVVSDGEKVLDNYLLSGDEPLMLASLLPGVPVIVGDKVRAIYKANRLKNYKTIIIDDGFQTFKIKKDINILLLDLSGEKKDYQLLPIGKLREGLSAIARADIIIFTKPGGASSDLLKNYLSSFVDFNKQLLLESVFVFSLLEYTNNDFVKVDGLIDAPVLSFSGIENSSSFVGASNMFFLNIRHNLVFRDHCDYDKKELKKISCLLKKDNIHSIVTTMKDFVKIKNYFQNIHVYVVGVDCEIVNKSRLIKKLKLLKN